MLPPMRGLLLIGVALALGRAACAEPVEPAAVAAAACLASPGLESVRAVAAELQMIDDAQPGLVMLNPAPRRQPFRPGEVSITAWMTPDGAVRIAHIAARRRRAMTDGCTVRARAADAGALVARLAAGAPGGARLQLAGGEVVMLKLGEATLWLRLDGGPRLLPVMALEAPVTAEQQAAVLRALAGRPAEITLSNGP